MLVFEGNLLDTVVAVALDNDSVVKVSTRRPIGVGVGVVPTVLVERWCRLAGLQQKKGSPSLGLLQQFQLLLGVEGQRVSESLCICL